MKTDDIDLEAVHLLENSCGFAIGVEPSGLEVLPASEELKLVAGDGCGGCFYEWAAAATHGVAPIVYLSSYGETARIASSLIQALAIIVAFPGYWTDVLVAAHKSPTLVRRVIEQGEANLEPDSDRARRRLIELLNVDVQMAEQWLLAAVSQQPRFAPRLKTEDGMLDPESFGDRPYPG
jgi:hypothetical protein